MQFHTSLSVAAQRRKYTAVEERDPPPVKSPLFITQQGSRAPLLRQRHHLTVLCLQASFFFDVSWSRRRLDAYSEETGGFMTTSHVHICLCLPIILQKRCLQSHMPRTNYCLQRISEDWVMSSFQPAYCLLSHT